MDAMINTLNTNQKKAATSIDSHIRIIAGAGSGKTRVLMARIAYLVNEIGIMPNRILAITFTNKATNEMKERLRNSLGQQADIVRISTIHSLCVRILREDADEIGYPRSFTILDTDDQKQILRPIYKKMDLDIKQYSMPKVLGYISGYKTQHVNPKLALKMAETDNTFIIAQIYDAYEQVRLQMKAMDFDDLLIEAHRLLKDNLMVRTKWQNRLDYIHVDEFQDVDLIQYGIIRFLTGSGAFLCVVGDPDQTIYTWRGASVEIILRFDKDFPDSKTIILDQNYRSTKPILEASNKVISYNQDRIKKDLFTNVSGEEKILLNASSEENDEPVFVAREISKRIKNGMDYKDIAILYRSNYSSRAFERVFRTVGIPYIIYGGIRFYERQEIKDALCYLKLFTRPDAADLEQFSLDLAVLRVINQPKRGIGQKSIDALREEASRRKINLYKELQNPRDVSSAIKKKCASFVSIIEDLKKHRDDYSLEDFFDVMLEKTGYLKMLQEENEEERIENLKELKQDIAQALQEDPETTLVTYLQDVALFTDKSQEQQANSVSLMTVHAAKGLEFDTVFLVNFNDGVFPSTRSIQEGGRKSLEEERRLCYVAMTRAKQNLIITWNTGYSYMLESYKTASRFLMEIPEEYTYRYHEKKVISQTPVTSFSGNLISKANKKSTKYRKGDLVNHTVYGQGVIIKVEGTVATVAFSHGVGIKKLNALHPSLSKA